MLCVVGFVLSEAVCEHSLETLRTQERRYLVPGATFLGQPLGPDR